MVPRLLCNWLNVRIPSLFHLRMYRMDFFRVLQALLDMEKTKQAEMMKLFAEYRSEVPATAWLELELKRNTKNIDLFEMIIREAYDGVTLVVAGHHIMFTQAGS